MKLALSLHVLCVNALNNLSYSAVHRSPSHTHMVEGQFPMSKVALSLNYVPIWRSSHYAVTYVRYKRVTFKGGQKMW